MMIDWKIFDGYAQTVINNCLLLVEEIKREGKSIIIVLIVAKKFNEDVLDVNIVMVNLK